MNEHLPLRLTDIRAVFRLLGEVRELRNEPSQAQKHMVMQLCRLVGARQGASLRWRGFTATGTVTLIDFVGGGWACPKAAELWAEAMRQGSWRADPILDRATRIRHRTAAMLREELLADEQWYATETTNTLARMAEIDHHLVSWFRREPRDDVSGIVLHRMWGERRFGNRERSILQLFIDELYLLWRDGKFEAEPLVASPHLSPRECRVLDQLAGGASVKEIAVELGLSYRTIEDYVKALHRKFDVHSRGGLLAKYHGARH